MSGWIYYMQVGDLIKIGYAANVRERMKAYPPATRLLAVERGTYATEGARLHQFAGSLEWGDEWFRQTEELTDHIEALRRSVEVPSSMIHEFRHVSQRGAPRKRAPAGPKPAPAAVAAVWPTVAQAAEITQTSTKTIRRRIADGTLAARRIGPRLIRIDPESLAGLGSPLQYVAEELD